MRGSVTVYFAGDTGLFDGLSAIGDEGIDVALVPVDGWGPKVGAGHLDPDGAAEAVRLLRPRLAVRSTGAPTRPSAARSTTAEPQRSKFAALVPEAARIPSPGEHLNL